MSDDDEETQGIANAKSTRDLVLAEALKLAKRAVDHVVAHPDVHHVGFDDRMDCGGYEWHLAASYGRDHTFVAVTGHPHGTLTQQQGIFSSPEELAAVMQGGSASFQVNVPRAWVELAVRQQDAVIGVALGDSDADGYVRVNLSGEVEPPECS